jgi:hypothetical protein
MVTKGTLHGCRFLNDIIFHENVLYISKKSLELKGADVDLEIGMGIPFKN